MSQGNAQGSSAVREELARRWADIHSARRGDSSRLLVQSIQTRANIMQRKAQMNLASSSSGMTKPLGLGAGARSRAGSALAQSAELPKAPPAEPAAAAAEPAPSAEAGAPPGGSQAAAPSGLQAAEAKGGPAQAGATSWVQRSKEMQAAMHPALPKPVGLQVGGSSGSGAGGPGGVVPYAPGALAMTASGPEVVGVRRPTSSHMTNFELDRLFATSAAPRLAAALYGGDGHAAAHAAIQLRHRMAQRGRGSEGIVRNWDEQGEANVTTVPYNLPTYTDVQKKRRADAALSALPVETVVAGMVAEAPTCSICYEELREGEAIRRLPCAHMFHSHCISKWLHVKLTCPLDNLPVDESLEMLAASRGDDEAGGAERPADRAEAGAAPSPPPPASEPPPLPPGARGEGRPAGEEPRLPPVGLRELRAAAESAGVSVESVADALARRRADGLHESQAKKPLLVIE